MRKDAFILTEGDDADELAGSGNVISFIRPELGDPLSIGDLASIIVSDVAVRLSGDFRLPKVVAFAAGRDDSERR